MWAARHSLAAAVSASWLRFAPAGAAAVKMSPRCRRDTAAVTTKPTTTTTFLLSRSIHTSIPKLNYTDPHKVLGVKPGASKDEIKKAYRKLAVSSFPDNKKERNERTRKRTTYIYPKIHFHHQYLTALTKAVALQLFYHTDTPIIS